MTRLVHFEPMVIPITTPDDYKLAHYLPSRASGLVCAFFGVAGDAAGGLDRRR